MSPNIYLSINASHITLKQVVQLTIEDWVGDLSSILSVLDRLQLKPWNFEHKLYEPDNQKSYIHIF